MVRIETPYDDEGAWRLAQIALELDPRVTEYKESELAGGAWIAVTDAPDGPLCARCGARFESHSSCPECGADRIGLHTVRLPDRFTVTVTETDSGSAIELGVPGDSDELPTGSESELEFVATLRRLQDEHEEIESAEAELLQASGGFRKEVTQLSPADNGTDKKNSDGTVALDIIKISIVIGVMGAVIVLAFFLLAT